MSQVQRATVRVAFYCPQEKARKVEVEVPEGLPIKKATIEAAITPDLAEEWALQDNAPITCPRCKGYLIVGRADLTDEQIVEAASAPNLGTFAVRAGDR